MAAAAAAATESLPTAIATALLTLSVLISAVSAQCNTITTYNEATSRVPLSTMVRAARNAQEFIGFDPQIISNGTGTVSFVNDLSASAFEPMFCKIEFEGPNEDSTIELGRGHPIEFKLYMYLILPRIVFCRSV